MKCCGYSLTQSPARIAAAIPTAILTTALAIKTGLVAYEIFSGCPNSVSTPSAYYNFFPNASGCDQQITDAFYSGASTLIAAATTAIISLTKKPKVEVAPDLVPDPAEINKLIDGIVGGHNGDIPAKQGKLDTLNEEIVKTHPEGKPRSLSVGATPRRLVAGAKGIVVVDPSKIKPNPTLQAEFNKFYPESTS